MALDALIGNEEREALSAVGSFVTQLLSILKQLLAFGYSIADKILTLMHERPIELMMGMGSIYILLN